MSDQQERAPRTKERISYLVKWAQMESLTESLRAVLDAEASNKWNTDYQGNIARGKPLLECEMDIALDTTHGGYHYEFADSSALARLDSLLDGYEAKIADPKYLIRKSPLIMEAVQKMIDGGRRPAVKEAAIAIQSMGERDTATFVNGMKHYADISGGEPLYVLPWKVNSLFVFKGSEEEILQKFEGVVLKKSMPVPRTVLVKMAALRMRKLVEDMVAHNVQALKQIELYKSDPVKNGHLKDSKVFPITELRTMEVCRYLSQNFGSLQNAYYWQRHLKEFVDFLDKDGVDDSVLSDGWDIQVVRDVMNS